MRKAFTLIELLVVITIIVVLLSLLTPALDTAVYQTERIVCLSNTRVQHAAQYQYAYDNARRLTDRGGAQSPDYHRWGGAPRSPVAVLRGTYLPSTRALICPIVAQAPSQPYGEYRRNDWSTSQNGDPVTQAVNLLGTYGGWDTDSTNIYCAYSWLGGFGGGVSYTQPSGESRPPTKTSEMTSGGLFITHRLDFYGPGSVHEITHGGRGLAQVGAIPDVYQATEMPHTYGDGHAIIRTRDQIEVRMTINGGDYHMW
jgi:prepilin-type N-terminal cleavage/methylation domain-containing protein